MAVPAWEMASSAYSTWYSRPSGEKMVVYGTRLACISSLMADVLALGAQAGRTRES